MTDEEKAKEAKEIVCKDCKWQICCSNQCSILLNTVKAIDVGLAEGRKELREELSKIADTMCKEMNNYGWGGWKEDLYNSITNIIKEKGK